MFIAVGIGVILDRSSIHFNSLLSRIRKAERRGHISTEAANASITIILSKTSGEDIDTLDSAFGEFVRWIKTKNDLGQNVTGQIEQLWRDYRGRKIT